MQKGGSTELKGWLPEFVPCPECGGGIILNEDERKSGAFVCPHCGHFVDLVKTYVKKAPRKTKVHRVGNVDVVSKVTGRNLTGLKNATLRVGSEDLVLRGWGPLTYDERIGKVLWGIMLSAGMALPMGFRNGNWFAALLFFLFNVSLVWLSTKKGYFKEAFKLADLEQVWVLKDGSGGGLTTRKGHRLSWQFPERSVYFHFLGRLLTKWSGRVEITDTLRSPETAESSVPPTGNVEDSTV